MGMFRWIASVFTWCDELIYGEEGTKEVKRRVSTQSRTKMRGCQRKRLKKECNNPDVKKFISESVVFNKEYRTPSQAIFSEYVSWCVKNGKHYNTKSGFFRAFNFHCRAKPIFQTAIDRIQAYGGVGLKYDHLEEFDELPF